MDKKKTGKVFTTFALIVIGAGVGFIAAKMGMDSAKTTPPSQVVALIILFLPAFFLVVAVHEAGHALAGTWVNFDFRMYVVGPFMWDKEESGWTFKWNKNVNLSGGLVLCLPTTQENLSRRFSVYALGGPLASFIFTGVAFAIRLLIQNSSPSGHLVFTTAASFFGLVSFLSLIIFFVTMIPLHTDGFYTDGARALRFLRGGDTSRFEILLLKIITSSAGGIRPRLLNRDEMKEAMVLGERIGAPMKTYLYLYFYQAAFDEENYIEAEQYLKAYLAEKESIPKGLRGSVFLDAAFFYAFAFKDLKMSESYWAQYVPSAIIPRASVLATEAALLYLRKEYQASEQKLDLALQSLPSMLDRGVAIVLRDKLIQMKNNINSARKALRVNEANESKVY